MQFKSNLYTSGRKGSAESSYPPKMYIASPKMQLLWPSLAAGISPQTLGLVHFRVFVSNTYRVLHGMLSFRPPKRYTWIEKEISRNNCRVLDIYIVTLEIGILQFSLWCFFIALLFIGCRRNKCNFQAGSQSKRFFFCATKFDLHALKMKIFLLLPISKFRVM